MNEDMDFNIPIVGGGAFNFSATKPEVLGATEYTIVTLVVDISGSVIPFSNELLETVKSVVTACQKSPRAENLLFRLISFNDTVMEVHGFVQLNGIKADDYQALQCGGRTALFDAVHEAIGATISYGQRLIDQDFDANAIVFVVTDGLDWGSTMTPRTIKDLVDKAVIGEQLESLTTILVGVNADDCEDALERFVKEANLSQFINIGDVTPQKLAKLAQFVSKSISSTSQSLGTGGASQQLIF
jgi:uncharacterized protein YegL